VDTVAEDEASPASTHTGVWVASADSVVHGSSAVGLQVGAVHRDDFADYGTRFEKYPCELVKDLSVCLLAESVPELGE
jgi:hypothetical protein